MKKVKILTIVLAIILATLIATNEIKIEEQEILVKLVKFYKILVKGE